MNLRVCVALIGLVSGLIAFSGSASAVERIALCGSQTVGTCVVDGDTFYFQSRKYNLSTINAPELACGPMRAVALRAARRLAALLSSGDVSLTRIRGNGQTAGTNESKFVAHAIVNGQDIGLVLMAEKLARTYNRLERRWC